MHFQQISKAVCLKFGSLLNCAMPQVFTIRRISDPTRLVAKFIASEPGDISYAEKEQISSRLFFTLSSDFLFEPTSYGVSRNLIGREPDFRTPNGREFWLYREHEQLPVF
jgi:hypothetical protein